LADSNAAVDGSKQRKHLAVGMIWPSTFGDEACPLGTGNYAHLPDAGRTALGHLAPLPEDRTIA